MGKLVPFFMTFKMRSSSTMIEIILCPWEGRDMFNLKIKLGSLFLFQIKRPMQLIRMIFMLIFCREG